MNELTPIDAPALLPLADSWEINQLETDLKTVFLTVFESMIRPRERQLNLYGMPHLGETDLIARALKDYGVAAVARDDVQTSFLLMAAKSRNPRRGLIFLRQYLQSVWPNVWLVQPLWHPVATATQYPTGKTPLQNKDLGSGITVEYPTDGTGTPTVYNSSSGTKVVMVAGTDYTLSADGIASFPGGVPVATPIVYFRTGRIRITLPVASDNGLGLLEIAKAFRSTLAARLMLELQLSTVFENVGADGGLALANGASGIMPVSLTGTFI